MTMNVRSKPNWKENQNYAFQEFQEIIGTVTIVLIRNASLIVIQIETKIRLSKNTQERQVMHIV